MIRAMSETNGQHVETQAAVEGDDAALETGGDVEADTDALAAAVAATSPRPTPASPSTPNTAATSPARPPRKPSRIIPLMLALVVIGLVVAYVQWYRPRESLLRLQEQ